MHRAALFAVRPTQHGAAVNTLTEEGFFDRSPDPDHGRRNPVTLTNHGLRRLRRMDKLPDRPRDGLLAPLSPEDRQTPTACSGRCSPTTNRDQTRPGPTTRWEAGPRPGW
ncbi:hypothetical protein [Embleya sp. MST-111070]|uniref:hypothetical protein n=1 Tax=Embleya sp. MST-111070 TaxID=3398231 RepID=UPI003F73DCB5